MIQWHPDTLFGFGTSRSVTVLLLGIVIAELSPLIGCPEPPVIVTVKADCGLLITYDSPLGPVQSGIV